MSDASGAVLATTTFTDTHFRGGNISWRRISGRTVEFSIITAWRYNSGFNGLTVNFGDGAFSSFLNNSNVFVPVSVFSDSAGVQYEVLVHRVTHTYANDGPYTVGWGSCCRISPSSGMVNAPDAPYDYEMVVDLRSGNQGGPTTSLPIIVQMVQGTTNTLFMPVSDPDLDGTSCRMATTAESGIPTVAAATNALTVSSGCVLTWNTAGTTVGKKYAVQVMVEETHGTGGGQTPIDFMIEIVSSTPPTCAPLNEDLTVAVGTSITHSVTATDPDGSNLAFSSLSAPAGSSITVSAPGSTRTATFTWTPALADAGSAHAVSFIFTDEANLQTQCFLSIAVPTVLTDVSIAKAASPNPVVNGETLTYTLTATNAGPDGATNVVVTDTLPAAATFVSASSGCTGTTTVTCGPVDLAAGASTSWTIVTTVNTSATSITNTASVSATEPDGDLSNNTESETTGVIQNRLPICIDDIVLIPEDTVVSRDLLPNCTDPDPGDTIDIELVSLSLVSVEPFTVTDDLITGPFPFDLSLNTVKLDPAPNYNGTGGSLQFRAVDSQGGLSNNATLTVVVLPVNDPPEVDVNKATVTAPEGSNVTNSGTVGDIDGDTVTLTASAGTVVNNGDGTWNWSNAAPDGPAAYTVTITADDGNGGTASTSFTANVTNVAPELVAANVTSPIDEGGTAIFSGTFSDPGVDDHTLVVNWGDGSPDQTVILTGGTRSFSIPRTFVDDDPSGTASDVYDVTIVSLTDSDGAAAGTAVGGNIFLTGHDPDFHAVGPWEPGADNLLRIALDYVTSGTADDGNNPATKFLWVESQIPVPLGHRRGQQGLTDIGLILGEDYDWVSAAQVPSVDFNDYTAIAVASGFGGTLTRAELDALIARSADIAAFVNDGGGLFASSECEACGAGLLGTAPDLFGFVPVAVSSINATPPFNVTPFGAGLGLVNRDLQSPTHNSFADAGVLNVVDFDTAGKPTTLAGNVRISDGGLSRGYPVRVNNLDPEIVSLSLTSAPPLVEGGVASIGATFTDPGVFDTHTATIDWGDGSPVTSPAVTDNPGLPNGSAFANHIYADSGSYTVTLCVRDDDTGEDCRTLFLPVLNAPPIVDAGLDQSVFRNDIVALLGTFTDPGATADEPYTWEWDLDGDGSFDDLGTAAHADPLPHFSSFALPGVYVLKLQVTDKDGDSGDDTVKIEVVNRAPVADAGGPYTAAEGETITLDGSGSFDLDAPDDITSWAWDLDDDGDFDDDGGVTVDFDALDGPATVTVHIEVCDVFGDCGTASAVVEITNVAPTVEAGPDQTVFRGDLVTLVGSFTDPAGSLDDLYTWEWDLDGDNLTDDAGTAAYGSLLPSNTSFATLGLRTLTLTVTDEDGALSFDTVAIDVVNRPPSCEEAAPSIAEIWPPNHKMVDIDVLGVTDGDGDPITINIDSIHQDEPVDAVGSGKTEPDGAGVGTSTAQVRAERSGSKKVPGDGRMYHIGFTASEGFDTCSGTVTVGVPHDQGKNSTVIDGGPLFDSTAP